MQEAHEAVARKIAPLAGPDGEACSQARGVNSASSQVATCRAGRRAGGTHGGGRASRSDLGLEDLGYLSSAGVRMVVVVRVLADGRRDEQGDGLDGAGAGGT